MPTDRPLCQNVWMIDAKAAVRKAMEYLKEMYDTDSFRDVMLEEADLSDDDRYWNVTIGFTRLQESVSEGPMATLIGSSAVYRREYRVFMIDAESGVVRSMKIRKVE